MIEKDEQAIIEAIKRVFGQTDEFVRSNLYEVYREDVEMFREGIKHARSRPEPGGGDDPTELIQSLWQQIADLQITIAELKSRVELTDEEAVHLLDIKDALEKNEIVTGDIYFLLMLADRITSSRGNE